MGNPILQHQTRRTNKPTNTLFQAIVGLQLQTIMSHEIVQTSITHNKTNDHDHNFFDEMTPKNDVWGLYDYCYEKQAYKSRILFGSIYSETIYLEFLDIVKEDNDNNNQNR